MFINKGDASFRTETNQRSSLRGNGTEIVFLSTILEDMKIIGRDLREVRARVEQSRF